MSENKIVTMRCNHPVKGTVITILAFAGLSKDDVGKIAYDDDCDDIRRHILSVAKECQENGFIVDTNKIGSSVSDAIKGVAGRRSSHQYKLVMSVLEFCSRNGCWSY